jgi:hypothetical protein
MAENVFILGAGASVEAGAPLMNNFIDVAEDLLRVDYFGVETEKIKKVFKTISMLQGIHAKSFLDLDNIESLFGAIEMAIIINKLGDYSKEEILDLKESLITLIVKTLEMTVNFPIRNKRITVNPSYQKLVELIKEKGIGNTSIITFNYDIALDYALSFNNISFDYCLTPNPQGRVKLLKLHGSINWGKCSVCNQIEPYSIKDFFSNRSFNFDEEDSGDFQIHISDRMRDLIKRHQHDNQYSFSPVIVPPTWNKTDYHGMLTNVWSTAAYELNHARNIYVFGYSLPETDSFFRYLFSLGTVGDSRIRRFWVFDPDNSGRIKERYQRMIGQGITNRFDYVEKKFGEGIIELRKRIL